MNIWTKQKLAEICDVRDGTHDSPKPATAGYPLVTSKHLINNKIDFTSAYFITDDDYSGVNKRSKVDKFDILISMIGTVGEIALVKEEPKFAIKNVGLLKTGNEGLGKYLFYYLISPAGKNTLKSFLTGSTQKFISLGKLRDLPITLPPEEYQRKITSVLSAYDDLIENNEKRIKTLEEMAQILYTEWFVKFKFPGYEKVKMIDSGTEYGIVPEGWMVKPLSKVADIVRGCSYSSEEIDDSAGDYYIVNLKSFNRGGGFRFDGAKYYSGEINENQKLNVGDIVIAVTDMTNDRAVIARPARIPEINEKITFSADVVKINSDALPNSFIYELLSTYKFTETTKQMANGANVLHLKPTAILEFETLIPEPMVLEKFDVICKPYISEIDKLLKLNNNLSKTRDLLIPQLVTGKREVK